ncbi:hypothetical protein GO755_32885 [Spirosoma sp. HMF4905]|uniref:Uncharacterized protein n=1 Tax=Spirosoma arboris TaxID=2682092 RepID=A0A7K1SM43_9BACT|nr:hypothetical protein [Spirosoma arboris]MVM34871.1 hypothetical protein [Spirosoma arboris]
MKTNQETTEIQAVEITKEYAMEQLIRLFKALENATEDTATAVAIIERISEGIEADPESAKKMFTPENVANVMLLKRKMDAGTFKPSDLEAAFPAIANFPLWPLVKQFIK